MRGISSCHVRENLGSLLRMRIETQTLVALSFRIRRMNQAHPRGEHCDCLRFHQLPITEDQVPDPTSSVNYRAKLSRRNMQDLLHVAVGCGDGLVRTAAVLTHV